MFGIVILDPVMYWKYNVTNFVTIWRWYALRVVSDIIISFNFVLGWLVDLRFEFYTAAHSCRYWCACEVALTFPFYCHCCIPITNKFHSPQMMFSRKGMPETQRMWGGAPDKSVCTDPQICKQSGTEARASNRCCPQTTDSSIYKSDQSDQVLHFEVYQDKPCFSCCQVQLYWGNQVVLWALQI